MKYIIVEGNTPTKLAEQVQIKIEHGYVPQGGMTSYQGTEEYDMISLYFSNHSGSEIDVTFCQAMIKVAKILI